MIGVLYGLGIVGVCESFVNGEIMDFIIGGSFFFINLLLCFRVEWFWRIVGVGDGRGLCVLVIIGLWRK